MLNIVMESTQEMTLRERRIAKFEEFIDQYIVDFLGQEFIINRLKPKHIKHENRLYIQQQIMPLLPALISDYNKMSRNSDKTIDHNHEWYEHLINNASFIDVCINIPIIEDISRTIWVDGSSDLYFFKKIEDSQIKNKLIILINEIIEMTEE